jgi:hypothetical protein
MGLLDRFRRKPPVPEWCSYFSPAQYEQFKLLTLAYFAEKSIPIDFTDGQIKVIGKEDTYGLGNIAMNCSRTPKNLWKSVIDTHFDRIQSVQMAGLGNFNDFTDIETQIVARLLPIDSPYVQMETALFREELPGIATLLMIDLPEAFAGVSSEARASWEIGDDALYALAVKNLRKRAQFEVSNVALDDWTVRTFTGESFLVASLALCLGELPGCVGAFGALVCVPTRHILLCMALDDAPNPAQIAALGKLSQKLFGDIAGPIHPGVFQASSGRFERLV